MLTERTAGEVEQAARTTPDPPLAIPTEEISSAASDGTGYLIVRIPASPVAPHMVDNRYFGRGDKTPKSSPSTRGAATLKPTASSCCAGDGLRGPNKGVGRAGG